MQSKPFQANSTTKMAWALSPGASFHATTPAVAVKAKIKVQAGPNSQSGGLSAGKRRLWNQGPTSVVSIPMIATKTAAPAATKTSPHSVQKVSILAKIVAADARDP